MKRFVIILSFLCMSLVALLLGVSCSNQANPAFVAPLQTVAVNNPAWTPTPTFTFTPTPTITPTPIPYPISGFNGPYALAIDSTGKQYVGDTGNSFIKQFVGGYLNTNWPSGKTKSPNGLSYGTPKAITTDAAGNIYVVGNGAAVSKYDINGNFITQYTASMSTTLEGIVCSGTTLYVSDTGNNQIVSFTLPGNNLNTGFGTGGKLPTSFTPYGLAVDGSGNLYVAGSDNNIHVYTSTGVAGTPLATITGFSSPYAVVLDSNNNLYVSDTGNHQVEEIASAGPHGNYSGSPINFYGKGSLSSPEGIALDSLNNVYVVDSGNNALFQFVP